MAALTTSPVGTIVAREAGGGRGARIEDVGRWLASKSGVPQLDGSTTRRLAVADSQSRDATPAAVWRTSGRGKVGSAGGRRIDAGVPGPRCDRARPSCRRQTEGAATYNIGRGTRRGRAPSRASLLSQVRGDGRWSVSCQARLAAMSKRLAEVGRDLKWHHSLTTRSTTISDAANRRRLAGPAEPDTLGGPVSEISPFRASRAHATKQHAIMSCHFPARPGRLGPLKPACGGSGLCASGRPPGATMGGDAQGRLNLNAAQAAPTDVRCACLVYQIQGTPARRCVTRGPGRTNAVQL